MALKPQPTQIPPASKPEAARLLDSATVLCLAPAWYITIPSVLFTHFEPIIPDYEGLSLQRICGSRWCFFVHLSQLMIR